MRGRCRSSRGHSTPASYCVAGPAGNVYRIALSQFLLLAGYAGRGARMLEVCPRRSRDGEHRHFGSLGRQHHTVATCRVPLRTVIKISGNIPFQYQNTVENTYRLLPRPPQMPAAPFKRLYRKRRGGQPTLSPQAHLAASLPIEC
jgi:hypothetical protein